MKSIGLKIFCFFPRKGMEVSIPWKKLSCFLFSFQEKDHSISFFLISSAVSGQILTIAVIYTVSLPPKPQELLVSSFTIQNCLFFFLAHLSFEVA